jgi:pimeloyl-ACP methyl ester carboxylesterase
MLSSMVPLRDTTMATLRLGNESACAPELIWAHGWGGSGTDLMRLAQALERDSASIVVDLPGFGASGLPPQRWGTADYADAIAEWISGLPKRRRVWIGYSFGCRVGIQLAARHPNVVDGMVLIAAAGLPRRRPPVRALVLKVCDFLFKLVRLLVAPGEVRNRLYIGTNTAEARKSGRMRGVFIRVVNENLSTVAERVACPTLLLYGAADRDTPTEIGERLLRLMPNAELQVLAGYDHHTILTAGEVEVIAKIRRFIWQ